MKIKKLNARGFTHDIAIVLVVVIVAIAGVGYLVASHADQVTCPTSGPSSGPVTGPVSGSCTPESYAILTTGQQLQSGQQLVSSDGQYALSLTKYGRLIVYSTSNRFTIWSNGVFQSKPKYPFDVTFSNSGSLTEYYQGGFKWSSGTQNTGPNNYLALLPGGNLVVYTEAGAAVWSSENGLDMLGSSQTLTPGQQIQSAYGNNTLEFKFSPSVGYGDLAVYSSGKLIWQAAGGDIYNPIKLVMQQNGALVLYGPFSKVLWTVGNANSSTATAGDYLVLLPDGNLVIYTPLDAVVWSSFYGNK